MMKTETTATLAAEQTEHRVPLALPRHAPASASSNRTRRIWRRCRARSASPLRTLTTWRDWFLAAGEAALASQAHGRRDARERAPEGAARRYAPQARAAGAEDHQPGGRAPFGPAEVEAMSRTVSPSSGKPYGLALVCRTWRAPRATVYRCRLPSRPEPAGRPGPVGPMSDTALLAVIRAVLAGSPFHDEGHRKIWARLRVAGVRTSKRRVLRLTRDNDLLAPSRVGSPRGPRSHDGTIIPEAGAMMWGTDLTTTITAKARRR